MSDSASDATAATARANHVVSMAAGARQICAQFGAARSLVPVQVRLSTLRRHCQTSRLASDGVGDLACRARRSRQLTYGVHAQLGRPRARDPEAQQDRFTHVLNPWPRQRTCQRLACFFLCRLAFDAVRLYPLEEPAMASLIDE